MIRIVSILAFLFVLSCSGFSQDNKEVKISGQVVLPHNVDQTFNLLVVNVRTAKGVFGAKDGSFQIEALKNDTILVGALGYKTVKISMKDSVLKDQYKVRIFLAPIEYSLREIRVMPRRELDSIQRDIRELGYDERDFMLSGIDAAISPITFLYQQFSRKEIRKREAYEQMNEDRMRALLKELFIKYVDYDIIDLDRREFDDFIDFMNINGYQLQGMSQYDFIMFTKRKFKEFRNSPSRLRQDINTHD